MGRRLRGVFDRGLGRGLPLLAVVVLVATAFGLAAVAATPDGHAADVRRDAASVAPAPSAGQSPRPPAGEGLVGVGTKLMLGSLLLAAGLFVVARSARRLPLAKLLPAADGPIKVIGRTHLAPKTSLALLEVGGTRLLVGITPAGLHALHCWDAASGAVVGPAERQTSRSGMPALPGQLRGLEARITGGRG